MYLNIVNNLSFGNKRSKNSIITKNEESNEDENESIKTSISDYELFYNSIFYGQLTQNWIKVTS
jgi:hypothetical protein